MKDLSAKEKIREKRKNVFKIIPTLKVESKITLYDKLFSVYWKVKQTLLQMARERRLIAWKLVLGWIGNHNIKVNNLSLQAARKSNLFLPDEETSGAQFHSPLLWLRQPLL